MASWSNQAKHKQLGCSEASHICQITYITQPCMSFANKMASGVYEDTLRAGHESEFKNYPSHQIFEKNCLKPFKIEFLAIFENL